ncbi:MAG: prolyl-tRNA synthetase associated domain-containing protein [Alphaproteobacteria bacterium]|nr:prolyl-tRNA synthetase associated domain-containing protein [Alphaproteobacteria bacterium]MDD9919958.1 prolyl-tRNA synthetase associated domain-containing protein [Alphaproteobacteria bacterium]
MHTAESLQTYLKQLNIAYTTHTHQPVFTVEESLSLIESQPGTHVKNLFLRDKKKTALWLITIRHDKKVDLKSLKDTLGANGNLSFCNADILWEKLGVKPGAVTPLAAINDTENHVTVVLDEDILQGSLVNAHPLQNDMTTALSPQDLLKFLQEVQHTPTIITIPEKQAEAA